MDEVELDSLKKMAKDLYSQNQKLKQQIKVLEDQIYTIFTQFRIVTGKPVQNALDCSKIADELIDGAKQELIIVTSAIDKHYLGKLIDKSKRNIEVLLVTSEAEQLKSKELKQYRENLRTIKSNISIKSFTNPATKSLVIIKDKERALISSGVLARDALTLTLNIGFLLTNQNVLNTLIRFIMLHLPRFAKIDFITVEEKEKM